VKRKRDDEGNLMGTSNKDFHLDTSVYEEGLDDGQNETHSANLNPEYMNEQIDEEGMLLGLVDEIVDHKMMADAIQMDSMLDAKGKIRETTKGWRVGGLVVMCRVEGWINFMGTFSNHEGVMTRCTTGSF
jgi:hypothetical protein